jgi:hypothetical protein
MEKRQLQQMLREMGVSFPPDATEATLVEILKRENQKQWTKASKSRVVKIKKKTEPKRDKTETAGSKPIRSFPKTNPVFKRPIQRVEHKLASPVMIRKEPSNALEPSREPQIPGAPAFDPSENSGEPSPAGTSGCCDLCEKSDPASDTTLTAYSFADQVTSKNTVFLCPDCISKVRDQADGREIRSLKRKARKRANSKLQISYGKVRKAWGYKP